jgi:hypothetical protein
MLAGERFSDRPRCVCRVIAAFLRSFNDRASHADRQRLVPYADRAVGTRGDREVTRERRDACLVWAGARPGGGPLRWFLQRLTMRVRIWVVVGGKEAIRLDEGAGEYAVRLVFARYGTEATFALLDHLLEIGEDPEPVAAPGRQDGGLLEAPALADPVEAATQARVAAAIGQLARDAEVSQSENGGQTGDHNGHARHLSGRNTGNGHEEGVEDDHAGDGDPERETEPAENPHDLARVP